MWAEITMDPHIWGCPKNDYSNKRATFPQKRVVIHSFQQVIHSYLCAEYPRRKIKIQPKA